jgi:hypothetical protein
MTATVRVITSRILIPQRKARRSSPPVVPYWVEQLMGRGASPSRVSCSWPMSRVGAVEHSGFVPERLASHIE